MVKDFHTYLISTAKHAFKIEPINYQGKYMPVCLILSCAEEVICMRQNSIYSFFIRDEHKFIPVSVLYIFVTAF